MGLHLWPRCLSPSEPGVPIPSHEQGPTPRPASVPLCHPTGCGEAGAGRRERLPLGEGEADCPELQPAAHPRAALHLRGPGLEGFLLVHGARGRARRGLCRAGLGGQWSCDRAEPVQHKNQAGHTPPDLLGLWGVRGRESGAQFLSPGPQFLSHGLCPYSWAQLGTGQLGLPLCLPPLCLGLSPGTWPGVCPVVPCRAEGTQSLGDMHGRAPPVSGRFPHCSQSALVLSQ